MKKYFILIFWGLILQLGYSQPKTVSMSDFHGSYVIDETMFKGENTYWQYDNYYFEITKKNKLLFQYCDGEGWHCDSGSVRLVSDTIPKCLILDVKKPRSHVINDIPLVKFYHNDLHIIFYSPKFGNMFFKKGRWKEHTNEDYLNTCVKLIAGDTVTVHVGEKLMLDFSYDPKSDYFHSYHTVDYIRDTIIDYFNHWEESPSFKHPLKESSICFFRATETGLARIASYIKAENQELFAKDNQQNFVSQKQLRKELDSVFAVLLKQEKIENKETYWYNKKSHEKKYGNDWGMDYLAKKYYGCEKALKIIKDFFSKYDLAHEPWYYSWHWQHCLPYFEAQLPYHKDLKLTVCFVKVIK